MWCICHSHELCWLSINLCIYHLICFSTSHPPASHHSKNHQHSIHLHISMTLNHEFYYLENLQNKWLHWETFKNLYLFCSLNWNSPNKQCLWSVRLLVRVSCLYKFLRNKDILAAIWRCSWVESKARLNWKVTDWVGNFESWESP